MKGSATIISICLAALVLWGGCSREEPPPPPAEKIKVVKPIKMPIPQRPKTPLPEGDEKAQGEAQEVKTIALEQSPLETVAREQETVVEEAAGYYTVKKGDSLSGIAERQDVYGDPLKWPLLYRDNMDELGSLPLAEALPDSELPEGLRLRIISPDEARQNLNSRLHKAWAVNVLSATTTEKMTPLAIRLMKRGYPVYITHATVKGKDWVRLRVGFFKHRTEADTQAKEIMSMLHLTGSWATKVEKKELEEFGGY
jgi:hypothetical protein